MKKLLIVLSLLTSISLVGCTTDKATDADQKTATGTNQEGTADQEKESLRQENEELKQKVTELETAIQYHDKAKELLNESFKLISAMNNKDSNYLISIAGPKVKISENSDKIDTDEYGEVNFLNIPMNELQYRGFVEQGSEDKFQIALARVSEKGNVEIYIDFVKVDNKWKYNGHVTN